MAFEAYFSINYTLNYCVLLCLVVGGQDCFSSIILSENQQIVIMFNEPLLLGLLVSIG